MTNRELKEELQELYEMGHEAARSSLCSEERNLREIAMEKINMLADTLIPEDED